MYVRASRSLPCSIRQPRSKNMLHAMPCMQAEPSVGQGAGGLVTYKLDEARCLMPDVIL